MKKIFLYCFILFCSVFTAFGRDTFLAATIPHTSSDTSTLLLFQNAGFGMPTFVSRSPGTKIALLPSVSASNVDYAFGLERSVSNTESWFSMPSNSPTHSLKLYGGTTQVARLDGKGNSQWEGQGRFKGWLGVGAAPTGAAAEIGVTAGGVAQLIGYDRSAGGYIPLSFSGGVGANNATTVLINNVGVGIGTLTPQSTLSVKGIITAQRVKVTQTGWADYVFHKNYPLPSLAEVEVYIQQHQHLEGIPSADEVTKEGIDVGEMNKKLLAKVEELTLYLIEQNKKIIALEAWKQQQEKKSISTTAP